MGAWPIVVACTYPLQSEDYIQTLSIMHCNIPLVFYVTVDGGMGLKSGYATCRYAGGYEEGVLRCYLEAQLARDLGSRLQQKLNQTIFYCFESFLLLF